MNTQQIQQKKEDFYQYLKSRFDVNLADASLIAQYLKEISDAEYCKGFEKATLRFKGAATTGELPAGPAVSAKVFAMRIMDALAARANYGTPLPSDNYVTEQIEAYATQFCTPVAPKEEGELPAPAIDLEHFLDYVGLNYTPVRFTDGVLWDLDDSEAPMSSEEVIQDYKEQFGELPAGPAVGFDKEKFFEAMQQAQKEMDEWDKGRMRRAKQAELDLAKIILTDSVAQKWTPADKDSDYDGTYLGYIEKHEVCGAINYYQRTVFNIQNKWVLNEGERLLYWMPLPPAPGTPVAPKEEGDPLGTVNRVEVIDHFHNEGRVYVKWNDYLKVELDYQDEGRTLKVLLTKK
jgi:hypothetical protein